MVSEDERLVTKPIVVGLLSPDLPASPLQAPHSQHQMFGEQLPPYWVKHNQQHTLDLLALSHLVLMVSY